MGTGDRPLGQVLDELDARLARVEAHLGLSPVEAPEVKMAPAAEAPPLDPSWLSHFAAVKRESALPGAVILPPAPPMQDLPVIPAAAVAPVRPSPPAPLPIIPDYVPTPSPRPAARAKSELEQTIGLKWSGWVGAVVVVIGVALGIKYAYDQNWFGILPPAARLALMSLAAFALIGAGEVVYRRIHVFAAACLYGAGVASLFLVSYAGFGYFRLYEQQTAFLLMALSTVAGAAVAMRGNFVSIAVLAQIGGNLAPLLLRSDNPRLVPFLAYLCTLQIVALALAWWGGRARWWTLRGMSLITTSLWLAAIFTEPRFASLRASKLTFCLIYAALFQAELVLSALRGGIIGVAPPEGAASTDKRGVTFSMLVTALLTVAVLYIFRGASDGVRGAWVLGLSGACAALGFLLTNDRRDARHNLGIGFRIQAAALLVVAVPVALAGIWIIVAWSVLAVAFAMLGSALKLPIARRAGAWVWRLAVLYLAWWTIDPTHAGHYRAAHEAWLHLFGAHVPAYTVVAWILACVGHAVAWLVQPGGWQAETEPDPKFQLVARITHSLAGIVWVAVSIAGVPPVGATLAILVYAWLLLGADLLNPRLGLVLQSGAIVALAMIKWLAVDTLADRLSPAWVATARTPVFNAVMGAGLLLSLTMAALYWLRRDVLWAALTRGSNRDRVVFAASNVSPAGAAIALAALLLFIFTVGLSFEIDRIVEAAAGGASVWPAAQVKQMAWTVLWTTVVCAFVALARRLEPDPRLRPRWVAVAEQAAVVLAVKFLVVDTLVFRATHGASRAAAPVANLQSFTALVVVAGLIVVSYLMTRGGAGEQDAEGGPGETRAIFSVAGFLSVLVVLWAGTLEIDRGFERLIAAGSTAFGDPRLARQVAFSIFWSLFAVSSVVAGFRFRTAGLRYFGLGLFAVTLLKVVLVDMGQVQTGYRVLSFLGLGLLMMGTSVLYGKLSPMLLRDRQNATA